VQPELSTRCSLYIRPNGYNQIGREAGPVGTSPGQARGALDPYLV
jgi:hypothetical protein